MRVLVCGSRTFNDYEVFYIEMQKIMDPSDISCIIHGGAKGADSLAQQYAKDYDINTRIEFPDWSIGPYAGILRNTKMLEHNPDLVIAIWDGESRGTKNMIEQATKAGIPVKVINV